MQTVSLVGYSDKLSARPGDKIDFMVSSQSDAPYEARLFRSAFVQLEGFVHVNSCRCLDGVGRMVRVRSFFIQLQEVQIPQLQ